MERNEGLRRISFVLMLLSAAFCLVTLLLAIRSLNNVHMSVGVWGLNRAGDADVFLQYRFMLLGCLVLGLAALILFAVYVSQIRMRYANMGIPFAASAARFRLYLALPVLNLFIPPVPILELIDHQGAILGRSKTVPDESYPQPRGVRIGFQLFVLLIIGTLIYSLIQSPVLYPPSSLKWLLQQSKFEGEAYRSFMNLILAGLAFLMGTLLVYWIGRLDRGIQRMQDAGELVTEFPKGEPALRIVDDAEAFEQEKAQRLQDLRDASAENADETDFF